MITANIQQVTTRSQAKNMEWTKQDDIRKVAQAWVEKANEANAQRMRQKFATTTERMEGTTLTPNPIWQALVDYKITLTMEKLLQLVTQFQ